ncbi:hypothetical protein CGRA01v4_12977 [Colletotrichum graminicola]|nr:hypothetical protein CGRA01v4_12977 [Colletotrichum graminicola]
MVVVGSVSRVTQLDNPGCAWKLARRGQSPRRKMPQQRCNPQPTCPETSRRGKGDGRVLHIFRDFSYIAIYWGRGWKAPEPRPSLSLSLSLPPVSPIRNAWRVKVVISVQGATRHCLGRSSDSKFQKPYPPLP